MTEQLQFEPLSHQYWVVNEKTGEKEQVPSVTQILKVISPYYRASELTLNPYAQRGTEVHSLTEEYDKAGPSFHIGNVPEDRAGYLLAWINFRQDFDFEPLYIEQRVYDPKLFYAGTLDRVGIVRGRMSVIDIKSGGSGSVGPAVGVQLAAYQHAFTEEECDGRYAVQVAGDGTYKVIEYTNPLDWDCFRGCLALYTWQQGHRFELADVRPRIITSDDETHSSWTQVSRQATGKVK